MREGKNVKADKKKLELAMATACMNTEDIQKVSNMWKAGQNI